MYTHAMVEFSSLWYYWYSCTLVQNIKDSLIFCFRKPWWALQGNRPDVYRVLWVMKHLRGCMLAHISPFLRRPMSSDLQHPVREHIWKKHFEEKLSNVSLGFIWSYKNQKCYMVIYIELCCICFEVRAHVPQATLKLSELRMNLVTCVLFCQC